MEDRNHDIAQLLLKNLQGALTPAEQQKLDAWMEASPVNRAIFDNIDSADAVVRELRVYEEARNIGKNVRKRLEQVLAQSQPSVLPVPQPKPVFYRHWWHAAAAVVIIGVSIWLLFQSPFSNVIPTYPKNYPHESLIITATLKDQKRMLNLPDNSLVWLNAGSRIQSPKSFPATERKVQLEGRAIFKVESAYNNGKKIPFIVAVKDGDAAVGQIEVLGTRFEIDAYSSSQYYTARVFEGRIKVSNSTDSKIVETNQVAYWTKNSSINVQVATDIEANLLQKDSTLKFYNTPIQLVYDSLESVFGVTVQYKNNIKPERQFSGELYTPSGIRTVLKVINHQCDLSSVYDSLQRQIIVQ